MYVFFLTEPEFSSKISKSNPIVSPVTIEILTAVLTSLKHLDVNEILHFYRAMLRRARL